MFIIFDDVVCCMLKEEEKLVNFSDWGYDVLVFVCWCFEYGYFLKQVGFIVQILVSLLVLWQVVNWLGGKEGYFFGNILWQMCVVMDCLVGYKLVKGCLLYILFKSGDMVDSWKVIIVELEKQFMFLFGMKVLGLGWFSFMLYDKGCYCEIDVCVWWYLYGMLGLIYWLLMILVYLFIFWGMVRCIV